jgi:predicted nucleic acid-binding protein
VTSEKGLLDTSAVIGLESVAIERLPLESAVSALTLAELAGGPASTPDASLRARRQDRLQRVESTFESISFDPACARAYGRIYAEVAALGRKPRGPRSVDLMIAATALAHDIPLFTLNASDLRGLDGLIEIVDLDP